jgi:hypothetical protein
MLDFFHRIILISRTFLQRAVNFETVSIKSVYHPEVSSTDTSKVPCFQLPGNFLSNDCCCTAVVDQTCNGISSTDKYKMQCFQLPGNFFSNNCCGTAGVDQTGCRVSSTDTYKMLCFQLATSSLDDCRCTAVVEQARALCYSRYKIRLTFQQVKLFS